MILTVHSDPALLLTHRLQKDSIQHATGYCPADWDDRVQILRGQRRVGLQPGEHLRPRQRLRGSSGRRGELHGVPGGKNKRRRGGLPGCGKGTTARSPAPERRRRARTPLTSFPAAHRPRVGRRSPPASGGWNPGREAGPAWPRAEAGPGSGAGPERTRCTGERGLASRPRVAFLSPGVRVRERPGLGLRMERGQAGLGSGASPLGAAPSDRLPPPPPRGHRAPAPSA